MDAIDEILKSGRFDRPVDVSEKQRLVLDMVRDFDTYLRKAGFAMAMIVMGETLPAGGHMTIAFGKGMLPEDANQLVKLLGRLAEQNQIGTNAIISEGYSKG